MSSDQWNRVNELFYAALEKDEEQRNSFLVDACGNDELLRQEVESLLSAHHDAGNFIQTPAVKNALEILAEDSEQLTIGQQIGPYKIIREIGRGGMGAVYLAERADHQFAQHAALKLVRMGMNTEIILRRFRNERQILANFDHPNIARLLDGGTTTKGLPYFVMEYVEGLPIDQYCDSKNLTINERLKLFREVCMAVAYAHRHLVIHRDLKPSNILVTADGIPKLLDFGIAKVLQASEEEEFAQTLTAHPPMTPDYASPEQAQGLPATTLTDIYSLGIVLYELLTGHLPYQVKTHSPLEVARIILETEFPIPSAIVHGEEKDEEKTAESISRTREGTPDRLSRRLRGDLDNIVLMALRKEPERRYQSVQQFSEDIQRHLDGLPVLARKDTLTYRGTKFVRRNKFAVAAATIAILATLISIIVAGFIQWKANQQAKFLQEFGQEAARMEGIMRFAYLLPLHSVLPETKIVQNQIQSLEEKMNRIGGVAYGPGNYALGRGWMSLYEYEKAQKHLELSWNRYQYHEPHVANALGLTLAMLYQRELEKASRIRSKSERDSRLKEIEKEFREPALQYIKEGKAATDSPEFVTAIILFLERKDEAALSFAEKSWKKVPWLYEAIRLQGDILTNRGNEHQRKGNYEAALGEYERAESAYHRAIDSGRSDSETYRALCNLQNDVLRLKVYETGESPILTFSKSESACGNAVKAMPDNAETYSSLISIYTVYAYYQTWSSNEDSRPILEKAIQAGELSLKLRPDSVETQRRVGRIYISRGEYDLNHGLDPSPWMEKANHHLKLAIQMDPLFASAYLNLGLSQYLSAVYVLESGGDPRPYLKNALENQKKAIQLQPKSAGFYRDIAPTLLLQVEYELDHGIDIYPTVNSAVDYLTRSVELNPNEQVAHFNLGQARVFQAIHEVSRGINPAKTLEQARKSLTKAIEINSLDEYSYLVLGWSDQVQAQYAADAGQDPQEWIQKSERHLKKALEITPDRSLTFLYLGMLYLIHSEIQIEAGTNPNASLNDARKALENARSLPSDVRGEILFNLGKTEMIAARWNLRTKQSTKPYAKRAVELLEEAVRMNSQIAGAYLALAQVDSLYIRENPLSPSANGHMGSALSHLKKAIELNPQLAEAYALKGELLQLRELTADSNAAYQKAFELNPLLKRKYNRS